VYVRLLLATNDPEGTREVRSAVERHPKNGYLHHLLYTLLDDAGDPRALEALDKAVGLETLPARKRRWIEQLLTQALQEDRRDLAAKHLGVLAELLGGGAEAHLGAARKMQEFGFHERALTELEAARKGYEAFATGDMETVLSVWADDIVWHVGGNGPLAGTYKGKEEVLAMMGRLMQETDGTFKNEVHDILTNGTHGVALVTASASRNGKTAEGRVVHVWHDDGEARMKEFWAIGENQADFDALWD